MAFRNPEAVAERAGSKAGDFGRELVTPDSTLVLLLFSAPWASYACRTCAHPSRVPHRPEERDKVGREREASLFNAMELCLKPWNDQ